MYVYYVYVSAGVWHFSSVFHVSTPCDGMVVEAEFVLKSLKSFFTHLEYTIRVLLSPFGI